MILSWLLQGAILAIFIVAALLVGLRLAGWRPNAKDATAVGGAIDDAQRSSPPPVTANPVAPAPTIAAAAAPPEPAPAVQPAPAPVPVPQHTLSSDRELAPELEDMRHAFEFSDDDRLTIILEMPVDVLDKDRALVDIWVEAVGWARLERAGKTMSPGASQPQPLSQAQVLGSTEAEQLQVQLDEVLHRLQLSAERRREMRALLDQNMPRAETV